MRICKILFSKTRVIAAVILIISILISLISCGEKRSCRELMSEFSECIGESGTVYSPSVGEGESGYIGEDFFYLMYSDENTYAEDYAVLLSSRSDTVSECALFLAYSSYDAHLLTKLLRGRLDLIGSLLGTVNTDSAKDGFILRHGRYVVMCAVDDNEKARSVWQHILDFV